MSAFCYVYVLRSQRDGPLYTGLSYDLRRRVAEHNAGEVPSTASRRPMELVYYEACRNRADAGHRELYRKSAWGKRYLKARLKNYLTGGTTAPTAVARLTGTWPKNSSHSTLNSHQYAYNPGNQRTQQVFDAGSLASIWWGGGCIMHRYF